MPLYVSSTRAHRQEAKILLYSLWYHHTETSEWSKITKITKITKIQYYILEHKCMKLVNIKINILKCTVSKKKNCVRLLPSVIFYFKNRM